MLSLLPQNAWLLIATALSWLAPTSREARPPRLSRLSDEWLRQHQRDAGKHGPLA